MNSYRQQFPPSELQYFITPAHDCSYIENKPSRMVFLDPKQKIDVVTLSDLSRSGFRRSGDFIYKPECHHCRQCLSCRIPVQDFKMNSQQKKAWKRNQDLTTKIIPIKEFTTQHYELYEKYIHLRHFDGDMYPPSEEQFEKFLIENVIDGFFLELWKDDTLISVSACDVLDDGLSAVYTFFEPNEQKRSLGVFAILKQIEYIKSKQLGYVYLGYWVPHAKKMRYKSQYLPFEVLVDSRWQRLNRALTDQEIDQFGESLMTRFPSGWDRLIKQKL